MTPGHEAGRPADAAGDESQSIADLLRLDSVCDAFEESWKAGSRPRLEEYLESTNLPSATLFVELVQIDIDYRRRHGESPSVGEYAVKFPQFEDALSEIASLVGVTDATVSVPVKPLPMLGRFELATELGRGSFGIVWKAWDTRMRRWVALKQFHEGIARGNRKLYEREARAVAQLDHPNVVRVLELSEGSAIDYIVFELIEGESLKSWLAAREGKPVDPRLAAQIVLQIAQGLQHVHERDIVHRDLKPGNILITKEGVPKLVDFGLARHLDSLSTIAHDKTLLGTIPYMSPEQCQAAKVTAATDIYSLGVVLYEMLAGRRPFSGGHNDLMGQIRYKEPPPIKGNSPLLQSLERICRRALEKDARDRYPTAAAMAGDLQWAQEGASLPKSRTSYRKFFRKWWNVRAVGTGVAGAALVALAFASGQSSEDGLVRVRMATDPPGASVTFIPLGVADGRPQPDQKVPAPTASPVDLRLPPGDYLVVAQTEDKNFAFHEVYRHIPRDAKVYRGSHRHLSWTVEADGVSLPPVKLPAADVTESMAIVDSAEQFELRKVEADSGRQPQHCSIPSFYIDRQEYTLREFKERSLKRLGPDASQKAIAAFQPAADDVNAKTLSWDEAVAEAEASGKRLLHEWEFALVATARGTSRYPWGSDLPRDLATARPGPVGVPAFDRVLSNGSAIVGLGSNVVEWVDTDVSLTPRLRTLDGIPLNTIGDKRVVMGGNHHCFEPGPSEPPPTPDPGMRSIVSRYTHHPGVGFRSARSVRPRLDEDDFVRLLRPELAEESAN